MRRRSCRFLQVFEGHPKSFQETSKDASEGPAMSPTTVQPKTTTKTKLQRPPLYKVILLNDDYTPREFVVTVLKAVFRMAEETASRVMLTAHQKGACVIAVYTRDVAETKAKEATELGKQKGYPLFFTTEEKKWRAPLPNPVDWFSVHWRGCENPLLAKPKVLAAAGAHTAPDEARLHPSVSASALYLFVVADATATHRGDVRHDSQLGTPATSPPAIRRRRSA